MAFRIYIPRPLTRGLVWALLLALQSTLAGTTLAEPAAMDLGQMSIEELMDIEVVSVSNRLQRLGDVAAAVYIISNEAIRRSGVTSIPEALRLAPGLHVARIDANKWAITSRGFNDQFANKLLVMIDGRSVYTPLFSGVWWDVQDVMLEDVERIEVVRGPGGTIWGANAVNGVINIITKRASDTQGVLVAGGAGSAERGFASARYGGSVGDDISYRGYFKYFTHEPFASDPGSVANDAWDAIRGGMRLDWSPGENDSITLQGDVYDGDSNQTLVIGTPDVQEVSGANILADWVHDFEGQAVLHVTSYWDRTIRDMQAVAREDRNTFDFQMNYQRVLGSRNNFLVGTGYRMTTDDVVGRALAMSPASRTDHVFSAFVQDELVLVRDRLTLTVGSKFEHNSYTDFEYQPSGRMLYAVNDRNRLWWAISRAVRTPSRSDHGITIFIPPTGFPPTIDTVRGSVNFVSEELLAYEIGYRAQPLDSISFELAGYYNDYDNLMTSEVVGVQTGQLCPPNFLIPACTFRSKQMQNNMQGRAWGVELNFSWMPLDYWTLEGGYTYMKVDLLPDAGSSGDSLNSEGDTPEHQISMRSHLQLPFDIEFDTILYWVDELPDADIPSYERLDLRAAWLPLDGRLELSIAGQNLTQACHGEFRDGLISLRSHVPRSVYGKVVWRY